MRGGSGLIQIEPGPEKDAFRKFINNSTIIGETMHGSSGTVLRYRNDTDNVYKSTDANTFGEIVDTILVKFIHLNNPLDNSSTYERFKLEVDTQKDVYNKTKYGLEPLCPAIVFSGRFQVSDSIIQLLKSKAGENDPILDDTIDFVGIIAMEFMSDYVSMNTLLRDKHEYAMATFTAAAFLLIELTHKTGYTQGDFHVHNILFKILPEDAKYPYFLTDELFPSNLESPELAFDEQSAKRRRIRSPEKNITNAPSFSSDLVSFIRQLKPIIIDFGMAKKNDNISPFYDTYQFRKILATICAAGNIENVNNNGNNVTFSNDILRNAHHYSWASGTQEPIGFNEPGRAEYEKYVQAINDGNIDELVFFKFPGYSIEEIVDYVEFHNENYPDKLTVEQVKNDHVFNLNLTPTDTQFLNTHLDGVDGIMNQLIKARTKSQKKILDSITEITGNDFESSPESNSHPSLKPFGWDDGLLVYEGGSKDIERIRKRKRKSRRFRKPKRLTDKKTRTCRFF